MKKKILYLMHVDWHWIKQRPHYLAEELSANFDVLVAHPHSNRRSHLVRNKTNLIRVPMLSLPFSRLKAISYINACIKSLYFWCLMLTYRPAIVWFTFPTLVPQFGLSLLKNKVIVYDCMDDAPEFKSSEVERQHILHIERELLGCAKIVLVTSENLRNKLLGRGATANKLTLVRNAFGGAIYDEIATTAVSDKQKDMFQILYFGTVSNYVDFDVLLHCVNSLEGVEFHFFGPVAIEVAKHERLKFYGAVEHSDLAARVQQFDCFIMPFIVNELIKGVDPVKLYEYINFNKNIICPYYPEIDRFSEFVFFYRSKDEFVAIVEILLKNNKLKYSSKQRWAFLENNSWAVRVSEVVKLINNLLQATPSKKMKRPNFFIVGAAKSGTSSIGDYLNKHPEIYISPIKEPHFFSEDFRIADFRSDYRERASFDIQAYLSIHPLPHKHIAHIEDQSQYLALFREVENEKAIGELSAGYLYSNCAAENLFEFNQNAKIVMVLRQPVERAYSHYLMNVRDLWDYDSGFINALERDFSSNKKGWGKSHLYVELGLYFEQVSRYLKCFPESQVKILLYEDLKDDPVGFIKELCEFLEVDLSALTAKDIAEHKNVAAFPRFKIPGAYLPALNVFRKYIGVLLPDKVKDQVRRVMFSSMNLPKLRDDEFEHAMKYFSEDIQKLSVLINRDLQGWHQMNK